MASAPLSLYHPHPSTQHSSSNFRDRNSSLPAATRTLPRNSGHQAASPLTSQFKYPSLPATPPSSLPLTQTNQMPNPFFEGTAGSSYTQQNACRDQGSEKEEKDNFMPRTSMYPVQSSDTLNALPTLNMDDDKRFLPITSQPASSKSTLENIRHFVTRFEIIFAALCWIAVGVLVAWTLLERHGTVVSVFLILAIVALGGIGTVFLVHIIVGCTKRSSKDKGDFIIPIPEEVEPKRPLPTKQYSSRGSRTMGQISVESSPFSSPNGSTTVLIPSGLDAPTLISTPSSPGAQSAFSSRTGLSLTELSAGGGSPKSYTPPSVTAARIASAHQSPPASPQPSQRGRQPRRSNGRKGSITAAGPSPLRSSSVPVSPVQEYPPVSSLHTSMSSRPSSSGVSGGSTNANQPSFKITITSHDDESDVPPPVPRK